MVQKLGLSDLMDLDPEVSAGEANAEDHGGEKKSRDDVDLRWAQDVRGPVPVTALGKTSTHEHMLVDMTNWYIPPELDEGLTNLPITLDTVGRIRRDPLANLANLLLDDIAEAAAEVRQFGLAGGKTIVDVTNDDFGRDPEGLRQIAESTDLNIIMGSGFYVANAHPADMDSRSVDDCASSIIQDIVVGAHEGQIRSGIIGEIGCSAGIEPNEEKALRAAALAQIETGAPVSIHQPVPFEKEAGKVLDILEEEGADLSHVVICHMDHTLEDRDYHKSVADRGCILEFDRFGNEWYYDSWGHWYEWRDDQRVEAIKWLIDQGYGDQITIGQDICYRICWTKYGGWGYGHLLTRIESMLEEMGIDEKWAKRILIETPRDFLGFRKPLP